MTIAVRSENLELSPFEEGKGLEAVVAEKSFAGGMLRIVLRLTDGTELISSRHGISSEVSEGERISVSWRPEHGVLVDLEGSN